MLFFFENGKAAKVELSAYRTTSNRRKLTGAYSDKSPLRTALCLREDCELAVYSTELRVLVFSTALLGSKTTRATQGVAVLTLKKKFTLDYACPAEATGHRQPRPLPRPQSPCGRRALKGGGQRRKTDIPDGLRKEVIA